MMFLTVVDVVMRYFINRPILGAFEITEFMMLLLVFFGLAFNHETQGNVRIDFIVKRASAKTRKLVKLLANIIGFGLFFLIAWQAIEFGLKISEENQVSRELGLPISPFIFAASTGAAILCLVLLLDLVKTLKANSQ